MDAVVCYLDSTLRTEALISSAAKSIATHRGSLPRNCPQRTEPPCPRFIPYPGTAYIQQQVDVGTTSSLFRTMWKCRPSSKAPTGSSEASVTLHRSHLPSPLPGVTPMSTPHKLHAHLSLFPGELDQPMKEAQG